MSEIRFNRWSHQSGTGGIYQDSSGNIGIGTSTPTSVLDIQGGSIKIGNDLLTSSGVSTFTSGLNVTSGSVGIGTDSPVSVLHVSGTTHVLGNGGAPLVWGDTSNLGSLTFDGSAQPVIRSASGKALVFQVNQSTEALRINSSGNVGIGTDNPARVLHTSGNLVRFDNNAGSGIILVDHANNKNFRLVTNIVNAASFSIEDMGTAVSGGGTARLTIDGSGNVGIGTDNPDNKLHVMGSVQVGKTEINGYETIINTNGLQFNRSSSSYIDQLGSGNLRFRYGAGYDIWMHMVGSTGNIGIGKDNPQSKLDVAGEVRASGIAITTSYPTISPSLNLNFARSRLLDSRITFTRASVGTYVGPDGLIKTADENEPRFDHDQNTLESLGLLIEDARVNSQTNSQPQSGSFTGGDATITYNTATAPNGETEACRIARNGSTSGSNYWRATRSINFNSNTMVLSCWAKAQDGNNYFVWSFQNLGGAIVRVGFKLTGDGETSIITNGNGGHTLQIEKYPDGWYRCIIIGNTQSSGTTTQFLYTASAYNEANSAVGGSTLVWGFQLEAGNFPTSYIPTSGAAVTRASDFATIGGNVFSDFYNEIEGTIVGEFTIDNIDNSAAAVANINASSGSSYADSIMFVEIGSDNGYFGRAYKSSSGLSLANASSVKGTLFPSTTPQSVAFAYTTVSGGELAAYWNGNYVNSNSSLSTVPSGLTELRIGRGWSHTSGVINARIKRLYYYPKRLVNNQLIAITS